MNMKKYIKPITKEINVDLSQMIAASLGIGTTPVDPSDSDAKEFDEMNDDWDSDYEEEE
jgi:hypothetical protein